MKCNSCNETIDVKFKHAISINACPFCGEKLLSDAIFGFRIKVTHILESNDIPLNKIDIVATEVVNAVMRTFVEDARVPATQMPQPIRRAAATSDRQLVKTGNQDIKEEDVEVQETSEHSYNPDDPDDPNNPENKEFINTIAWSGDADASRAIKARPAGMKPIPKPVSRL
jgi:hypothetical protein